MSLEIQLPLELAPMEKSCMICMDDLKYPVFCRRCKQPACFDCLEAWFRQKKECPTCRCVSSGCLDQGQKALYSCTRDDLLAEMYCEQCNECMCRKCYVSLEGHSRHPVRELDALRKEVQDGILRIQEMASPDVRQKTLGSIKAMLPKGTPHELVQQRRQVLAEIGKAVPPPAVVMAAPMMGKKAPYILPNEEYDDHRIKITDISRLSSHTFMHVDQRGNSWSLVVYPRGFSGGEKRFISLYITLLAGKPGRYEYRYMIFESNTTKPLADYFALDDFMIGTRSQGCQRLVQYTYALQKAVNTDGSFQISFGTRPTIAAFGPQCTVAFTANKTKSPNYRTFIFTVRDFPEQKEIERILFSNLVYDHHNTAWRFRVDCNGHEDRGAHLSAYLVLLNGAAGWYDIFIKLVHPTNPELSIRRELTHRFTVHSSWGNPRFVELSQIHSFMNSLNQLKFEYGMRPARVDQELQI